MLKVEFYTPNGFYKTIDVDHINVITSDGQRGVFENHMPMVSPLKISKLEAIKDGKSEYFAIGGGVLHFSDKVARVIVETVEDKESIDIKRAESAKERALKRIESKDPSIDIKRAEIALTKALNRIEVFNLGDINT